MGLDQTDQDEALDQQHELGDKRHATVTLTEAGQRTIADTLPHAQQITELTFGDLNAEERQQLVRLLRRISGAA